MEKTAKDLVDVNWFCHRGKRYQCRKTIFTRQLHVAVIYRQPDSGSGIGPNLTDKHWILGWVELKFSSTISEGGRDGKGMIAWKMI
jgi:cytochrome c oxidase cbb3-type subunit 3